MVQQAPQKTSSQVRIGLYEEMQRELMIRLKQKEKELKTLLAELQVTRNLLEEAEHDREEEESVTAAREKRESLEKEIESLEEVTKNVTSELINQNQTPYETISQQELAMATGYGARRDLYALMYKTSWTSEDANTFFAISDAHRVANEYDFNPLVRENLNQTYNVIQQVVQKREDQIKATYQPTLTRPSDINLEQTLSNIQLPSPSSNTQNTMYKPSEKEKYTSATPKILEILKKK